MKIMAIANVVTAILTIAPVLLAQNPADAAGPEPRVLIEQMGPLASSNAVFISSDMVGGSRVTGAPYSAQATTESTQTLADGNRIVHNTASMLYRDSQGRERRELPFPTLGGSNTSGQAAQMVMISDPIAGVNYTLDPNTRTAHKMPAPPSVKGQAAISGANVTVRGGAVLGMVTAGVPMPPPPDAGGAFFYRSTNGANAANLPVPKVEQLGTETVEGVQAVGTRTTTTIPAGQIGNEQDLTVVAERWYSPELKMTVMSKRTDPRMGEIDYSLTQINRSEPDPSLFQVPSDYTVSDAGPVRLQTKPQQ